MPQAGARGKHEGGRLREWGGGAGLALKGRTCEPRTMADVHGAAAEGAGQGSARRDRPRGPFPLAMRILWWVWCAVLVGPIFVGVLRGTFGP